MNKIKAFTYQELLVAMTISMIVVLLSLVIYQVINRYFNQYRSYHNILNAVYEFDFTLHHDFISADSVKVNENTIEIYGNGREPIKYLLDPNTICRTILEHRDSFYLIPIGMTGYLQNKKIISGEINSLQLTVLVNKKEYSMNYYFTPDSKHLMEKDNKDYQYIRFRKKN